MFCGFQGCVSLGPRQMQHDQLAYSRALGETQKREMLLNIVRLRYADPPTFLDTTQVIAGYNYTRSMSGGYYGYPASAVSNYFFGQGSLSMAENPTVTYQPLTGQQYAENIIRPISPTVIMPLSLGGMPIDTLLRLTAQSIDGLSNVRGLGTGPFGGGSVRFYLLLHDLKQLQAAGAMTVRITTDEPDESSGKKKSSSSGSSNGTPSTDGPEHAYLVLTATSDSNLQAIQAEVKRLLHLDPNAQEAEIVYGPYPKHAGQIAILTRSMLAMLTQLSYEMQVPEKDVHLGRTPPTIGQVGIENRSEVVIHCDRDVPDHSYASVEYKGRWYWIDDNDFRSKEAFTMVQVLSALAATSHGTGAVVTIPAG
ncbi:hypothetical protein [Saccharibacter floricola]|uniref:Uncharacterized protein n=1 Tax=Saccharibacter floricola DSM 15669 TaxID=1123227 RepID=A0ABQ0NYN2_9PROT|nr:hypothetical protein [Saccharibacter floricola]GBQ06374.1 hypothetical protein AA15669_0908 [Saccharibacter floricola DSM 15669]